jgi:CheY-like chemotaxis protein
MLCRTTLLIFLLKNTVLLSECNSNRNTKKGLHQSFIAIWISDTRPAAIPSLGRKQRIRARGTLANRYIRVSRYCHDHVSIAIPPVISSDRDRPPLSGALFRFGIPPALVCNVPADDKKSDIQSVVARRALAACPAVGVLLPFWATILSLKMKNQISVPGITVHGVGRRAFAGSPRVPVGRASSDLAAPVSVKSTPFPTKLQPTLVYFGCALLIANSASTSPTARLIPFDLNMPRKDGRECLREIGTDPSLRHLPVVILATSRAEEEVAGCYAEGVRSYIRKPVTFKGLAAAMRILSLHWFKIAEMPASEYTLDYDTYSY